MELYNVVCIKHKYNGKDNHPLLICRTCCNIFVIATKINRIGLNYGRQGDTAKTNG